MKNLFLIFTVFLVLCVPLSAQTPLELAAAWEKEHISAKPPAKVIHKDLQNYLEKLKKLGVKVEEVGRSFEDREIYQIEWGRGKTRIFLWSQMHGNEPTATSALIDMFAFLQKNRDKSWVKRLGNALTIRAVPMLNPDGAEIFQRANAQSIDINRDARELKTPEGRLLKKLRDEFQPEIGFNLHNQQDLTTVGQTTEQASISLLAVSGDPELQPHPGRPRNIRLCTVIFEALNPFIKGRIARYDGGYTASAFGDNFSDWGTPVILIETGGFHEQPRLFGVKLNFIAYLAALNAIADGSEKRADPAVYEKIPVNSGGRLYNFIFRNAEIIRLSEKPTSPEPEEPINSEQSAVPEPIRFAAPLRADVGLNFREDRTGEIHSLYVTNIGDLKVFRGLDEMDVRDFYLVTRSGTLRPGTSGELLFYKKTRPIDWGDPRFPEKHAPDASFSRGIWKSGAPAAGRQ